LTGPRGFAAISIDPTMEHTVRPAILYGDSYYSPVGRFLCHCVPKVASRSLLALLGQAFPDGSRIKHLDLGGKDFFDAVPGDLFRFAWVRS
jgi:hypothetical protein